MKPVLLISAALIVAGCASTYRSKTYQSMAVGAAVGALYGMSKPKDQGAYATMYSAAGGTAGAIYSLLVFDPDAEIEKQKSEITRLRDDMDQLSNPKVERQTTALFGNRVPEKYKALINPGEWKVSKLDTWVEDDENRLIHQDLLMELVPPSLIPISKPTKKPEETK